MRASNKGYAFESTVSSNSLGHVALEALTVRDILGEMKFHRQGKSAPLTSVESRFNRYFLIRQAELPFVKG